MVTAITMAKDLQSMNLEDLIGSLRAHEVVLQGDKPVKKVKTLALKASQQISSITKDHVQESQELEEVEGEKNHKKGGLNCVFGNFLGSESEVVQSLSEFRVYVQRIM